MFLALFSTCLAFFLQSLALDRLSSTTVSLLLTGEPVFTALFAYLFLGETLSAMGLLGAAVIVGTVVAATWADGRTPTAAPEKAPAPAPAATSVVPAASVAMAASAGASSAPAPLVPLRRRASGSSALVRARSRRKTGWPRSVSGLVFRTSLARPGALRLRRGLLTPPR
ncbi:MAG: EamA family transporter [Adlercreutzia equolifaciens]